MGQQTFTTIGSQTWTNPGGITEVTIKMWGGGGGGGGGGSSGAGGNGGASGWSEGTHTISGDISVHVGGPGVFGLGDGTSGDGAGGGGGSHCINDGTILQATGGGGGGGGGDNSDPAAGGFGGASGPPTAEVGGSSGTALGGGGALVAGPGLGGTGGADPGDAGDNLAGGDGGSNNATVGGAGGAGGPAGDGGGQDTGGFAGGGGGGGAGAGAGAPHAAGGGSSSVSGNAGGGGGGGGRTYFAGGATATTEEQGAGAGANDVAGDTDPDYQSPKGERGAGGATTANGTSGEPGLVVIIWVDAGPVVTDVDLGKNITDDPARPDSKGVTIDGADFGATQSDTKVWLTDNPVWGSEDVKVDQGTVGGWGDTSITDWDIVFGGLTEGDGNYLYVEKDPGGSPEVSDPCQLLISRPDFRRQVSGIIQLPNGTGVQTIWTPSSIDNDVHPIQGYLIEWTGNTLTNANRDRWNMGAAGVTRSNDVGISGAATHASGIERVRAQNFNADGTASFYLDAADGTPDVEGEWQINATTGALECNFSTNPGDNFQLRITAFAGRTCRVYLDTSAVSSSPLTGIPLPSDPALTIFFSVGSNWGGTSVFGIWGLGFWDGKASANAWWAAQRWDDFNDLSSIVQGGGGMGQYLGTSNTWEMTNLAYSADGINRQLAWSGTNADDVGFFMVWTDGHDCDTGIFVKETTGVDNVEEDIVSGLSYDPGWIYLCTGGKNDQDETTPLGYSMWISGTANSENSTIQSSCSARIDEGTSDFDCLCRMNQGSIIRQVDDGLPPLRGDITDMTGGRVQVQWTAASTDPYVFGYAVMEVTIDELEADAFWVPAA